MRCVHDPDFTFPPSVEKGEIFVILSDDDIWDSIGGCEVAVFDAAYWSQHHYEIHSLCHEAFVEAVREGKVRLFDLEKVVRYYLEHDTSQSAKLDWNP